MTSTSRQRGPYDDKQLYANHNRSDGVFVILQLCVTATVQVCEQYNREDSGPGSESCGNGMQGEWGTSREEPRVDWSPCTRSDPAERIDSSYSTAALCTRIYSCNALARSQMMSPFSTSHLCISALDLFIIETYKNLIKF